MIASFVRPFYTQLQIGQFVSQKRHKLGLSIDELAQTMTISSKMLERIEAGKKILTTLEMQIISDFIEIPFESLTAVQEDTDLSVLHRKNGDETEAARKTIHQAQLIFHEMLTQSIVRGQQTYGN